METPCPNCNHEMMLKIDDATQKHYVCAVCNHEMTIRKEQSEVQFAEGLGLP